jgi:hypothetical protein
MIVILESSDNILVEVDLSGSVYEKDNSHFDSPISYSMTVGPFAEEDFACLG